jgi:hypothetical protein
VDAFGHKSGVIDISFGMKINILFYDFYPGSLKTEGCLHFIEIFFCYASIVTGHLEALLAVGCNLKFFKKNIKSLIDFFKPLIEIQPINI